LFLTAALCDCVGGDLYRMRKLSGGTWILLVVLTIRLVGQVSAQSGIAHATFYGGADATGTNGIGLLHKLTSCMNCRVSSCHDVVDGKLWLFSLDARSQLGKQRWITN